MVVPPLAVPSLKARVCAQSSLPGSPLFSMSSAITAASRASPSMTGQMGWSFPEMVKPAAVILLLNLVKRTKRMSKTSSPLSLGTAASLVPGHPGHRGLGVVLLHLHLLCREGISLFLEQPSAISRSMGLQLLEGQMCPSTQSIQM